MFWWIVIGGSLLFIWILYSLFMSRTPEVAFHRLKLDDGMSIRKYEAYLSIQINVNLDDVGDRDKKIKILMAFLDGENDQRLTIKWIAPILIAHHGKESTISIVLPGQFTLANLPKPFHQDIQFVPVPERIMAVATYTWFNASCRFEHARKKLLHTLEQSSMRSISPATEAVFQMNWILPFLCKYEVMVEVEGISA